MAFLMLQKESLKMVQTKIVALKPEVIRPLIVCLSNAGFME
jgi:hypothetical protein